MDGTKRLKLPTSFYLRGALVCLSLFMIGVGISYLLDEQSQSFFFASEVCLEKEEITGFCLESEEVEIEPVDPILVMILIALLSFSSTINFRMMKIQYRKAKYGFKADWKE